MPTLDWSTLIDHRGDDSSAANDSADTRFLLATTRAGRLHVMTQQRLLADALAVYHQDPFPTQPVAWAALLEGSLDAFLAPRDVYYLSYFLSLGTKRWWQRIRGVRELADELRHQSARPWSSRLRRLTAASAAADPKTALGLARRHAAWRLLAAIDPLADTDDDLPDWEELNSRLLAAAEGPPEPPTVNHDEAEPSAWLRRLDAWLDRHTALARHTRLDLDAADPAPASYALKLSGSQLEVSARELRTRPRELLAARLLQSKPLEFQALKPPLELSVASLQQLTPQGFAELWTCCWALSTFLGRPQLLETLTLTSESAGLSQPVDPRDAAENTLGNAV